MTRQSTNAMSTPDIDAINLSSALSRLEQKILSPDPSSRLLHSSYERTKTAANLEYARTLLLRLEHTTANLKIQSRKQALQTDLLRHRNLIKRLNDRLYALSQQGDDNLSDGSSEDLLGEDQAETTSPVPSSSPNDALSSPSLNHHNGIPSPSTTTSTLRSRTKLLSPTSTITAHTLSGAPSKPLSPTSPTSSATLLEADTSTQEALTSSLLTLASSLKSSSLALSAALETDASVLATTASALDKNSDGMASASKRMGVLRKMSEGRWWWGRMVLYAGIAGLWIVAGGLVFLGPKVRF